MFSYVFDQIPVELREKGKSKVFVAHRYGEAGLDLRGAVRRAFEPELTPYYADTELGTHHLLVKVARRIAASNLVLLDLSGSNPNVMIELGLAVGLSKPILLCCHVKHNVPEFIRGVSIIRYRDYSQLTTILENQKHQVIEAAIASPRGSWCQLCQQQCEGRRKLPSHSNQSLIVDDAPGAGHKEDFRISLCQAFDLVGVTPITLENAKQLEMRLLCGLVYAVRFSKLTVFRFVNGMSPLVPFLFGLSFGLRVLPILLVERDPQVIPSDLAGYPWFEYSSFVQIQDFLSKQLPVLLKQLAASASLANWTSRFGPKAGEALSNIQTILAQGEMGFEDKIEAALILGLYAVKSRAGSLMLLSQADRLGIVAMIAPKIEMDEAGKWREFDISEGICGWVAREGKPYITGDVHSDPFYKESTFDKNLTSLAAVPIIHDGEILGILNADSRESDFFRQTDLEALEIVAGLLAPIIAREKYAPRRRETYGDSTQVRSQLLRDPICLSCNQPSVVLRFRRSEDEKGLRYRMISTCTSCGQEKLVRTYTLFSH